MQVLGNQDEPDALNYLAWSPNSQWVAASGTGQAEVWDAHSGGMLRRLEARAEILSGLAWSPDGHYIALNSFDLDGGWLQLFSGSTSEVLAEYSFTEASPITLAWAPDYPSGRLALGGALGLDIWEVASGAEGLADHHWLNANMSPVIALSWSPDGKQLVAATFEYVLMWDAATSERLDGISGEGVVFGPTGERLAIADFRQVMAVDSATLEPIFTYNRGSSLCPWACRLAWQPTGGLLAAGTEAGTIDIWDAATGLLLTTISGPRDSITDLAWSPDGQQLAATSLDGTLRVWALP